MATPTRMRRVAALAGAFLLISFCTAGCYTRLTTPKEAINYLDPDGVPLGPFAIKAPEYNTILRQQVQATGPAQSAYRFQPGTRVVIEVWGHAISTTVNIRPDGFIDLPLIGDVQAEGRTIAALKDEVSARYAEFFVEQPQVIVNTDVTENQETVRAGEVSVINPTGNSGVVNLTGDEYLSQVLANISALSATSEWNEIAIIRRGRVSDERYVIVCDMEMLFRNGDFDQDVKMRNGDIVFVPREKNTILQEIWASMGMLAQFSQNADLTTLYIERIEGY